MWFNTISTFNSHYNNYEEARLYIDDCIADIRKENRIVIVSGCASGTDSLGERYALENGFEIERYPAEWEKYGRSAGPKRNLKMVQTADCVICFWDGKSSGTKSMINYAEKLSKQVMIKKITLG